MNPAELPQPRSLRPNPVRLIELRSLHLPFDQAGRLPIEITPHRQESPRLPGSRPAVILDRIVFSKSPPEIGGGSEVDLPGAGREQQIDGGPRKASRYGLPRAMITMAGSEFHQGSMPRFLAACHYGSPVQALVKHQGLSELDLRIQAIR